MIGKARETARILAVVLAIGLAFTGAWALAAANEQEFEFTDVRRQSAEFMGYYESITLTPEQEAVNREALEPLPAPCCSNNSAYTCCCVCNMGRTWWGLAKHLIADRGYDADQVRATVVRWFEFINPEGHSGDSCTTGRCGRAFSDNGCGGMKPSQVAF